MRALALGSTFKNGLGPCLAMRSLMAASPSFGAIKQPPFRPPLIFGTNPFCCLCSFGAIVSIVSQKRLFHHSFHFSLVSSQPTAQRGQFGRSSERIEVRKRLSVRLRSFSKDPRSVRPVIGRATSFKVFPLALQFRGTGLAPRRVANVGDAPSVWH